MLAAGALTAVGVAGCAAAEPRVPQVELEGSLAHDYSSLDDLAAAASAVVLAEPSGAEFDRPLPKGYGLEDSAPTHYVTMKVTKLVAGKLETDSIDIVSPAADARTGKPTLAASGTYLIFLAPAMYGPDDPAGGYVAVGGPQGIFFGSDPSNETFVRIVRDSLPDSVALSDAAKASITKSEAELLHEGP